MQYELTASCSDSRNSMLTIPLYESVPDPEKVPLIDSLESGVSLYETREYFDWTLSPWKKNWNSCSIMANGIDLTTTSRPFLLQYGFVQFIVTITLQDGSVKILRSKYCSAFQTEETDNLKNMAHQILAIYEPYIWDLLRWPSQDQEGTLRPNQKEQQKYSMISGALQQGIGSDHVHLPLQRVLETYRRQSGYFKARPEYTIRKVPVSTPFHQVKKLTSESMLWSVRNGSLRKVPSGGLLAKGQHYLPMETLSESAERDYHIYENCTVLGFLDTVIRKIKEKEILNSDSIEFDVLRMIFYPEESGWDKAGLTEVEQLRYQYQRSLRLEERKIPRVNSIPKQTKRFQEILPYREIYHCMYDWFCGGASWSLGGNAVFRGNLADTLYEYFCWLQLLRMFCEKGYRRCADSKRTNYADERKSLPPFSNVVYLEKDQTKVTLYFEPPIATLKSSAASRACGISLVRTVMDRDKAENRYLENRWTPDFLIRVEQNSHVEYAVLDAKFRSAKMLTSNGFGQTLSPIEECLYKYFLTVSDAERLERPVRMMWLLQGRTGEFRRETRNQCNIIGKTQAEQALCYFPKSYFNSLSMGILPLTSYNTETAVEALWSEMEHIWRL